MNEFFLVGLHFAYVIAGVWSSPAESRLITQLLQNYTKYVRPVESSNESLTVEFEITVRSLLDVVCNCLT